MHPFWRGSIAVVAGVMAAATCYTLTFLLIDGRDSNTAIFKALWVSAVLSVFLLSPAVAVVVHGRLIRRYGLEPRETCCRRCGYILRGISEPRCPECGERI